jgi:predicted transcriptional regulator of viral defense system
MKPTDALGSLLGMGRPILETREVAVRLGTSVSRASHLLRSLEESGLIRRLRRGLWAINVDVDPYAVPPYLTAPLPAYVSFWSALAWHDMIEQIPRRIFVASLDRTKRVTTWRGLRRHCSIRSTSDLLKVVESSFLSLSCLRASYGNDSRIGSVVLGARA